MPVSPFQRARDDEGEDTTDTVNDAMDADVHVNGRKKRNTRQELKKRYAKLREDAQLAGVIPTTTEGALREERVDPRLQGCQQLPAIVREALKENWSTPDSAKPGIIGALLEPFFSTDIVLDKDGNQIRVPPNRQQLIELAKVLKLLDQSQWERDHPEAAGKIKGAGGGTSISVQTNIAAAQIVRDMIQQRIPMPIPTPIAVDIANLVGAVPVHTPLGMQPMGHAEPPPGP